MSNHFLLSAKYVNLKTWNRPFKAPTVVQHLQPHLLIIALSAVRRNTRGFGFPSWGLGVTVPTSTKPKPSLYKPSTASPCLSKPAAIPIGFLNFNPRTLTSCRQTEQTLREVQKCMQPTEETALWHAYQWRRVLVTVQRYQTQTYHLHCQHMGCLRPHNPLQQGHQLVGIETLISSHGEVGSKQEATWADDLHGFF